MRVFVPKDAAAIALGADDVAAAVRETAGARGIALDIVRNGSRGMFWLEPMIEAETPQGRIAYGPVEAAHVPGLFDAGFLTGGEHALRVGQPEEHPFLKRQTRLAFERCGITDPLCLNDYRAYKGFEGLKRAIADRASRDDRGRDPLRPARPRRRWLPDRHQVADRRRDERAPEIHRLQRR